MNQDSHVEGERQTAPRTGQTITALYTHPRDQQLKSKELQAQRSPSKNWTRDNATARDQIPVLVPSATTSEALRINHRKDSQLGIRKVHPLDRLDVLKPRSNSSHIPDLPRRLKTFAKWPQGSEAQPSPLQLALAGFVCLEHSSDIVQCPQCGFQSLGWRPDDDLLSIHLLAAPACLLAVQQHNKLETEQAASAKYLHGHQDQHWGAEAAADLYVDGTRTTMRWSQISENALRHKPVTKALYSQGGSSNILDRTRAMAAAGHSADDINQTFSLTDGEIHLKLKLDYDHDHHQASTLEHPHHRNPLSSSSSTSSSKLFALHAVLLSGRNLRRHSGSLCAADPAAVLRIKAQGETFDPGQSALCMRAVLFPASD
eukprot:698774-Rhodomonas_salina.4